MVRVVGDGWLAGWLEGWMDGGRTYLRVWSLDSEGVVIRLLRTRHVPMPGAPKAAGAPKAVHKRALGASR